VTLDDFFILLTALCERNDHAQKRALYLSPGNLRYVMRDITATDSGSAAKVCLVLVSG
jgi:hypothetical protein